jgi:hypothetical protein
MLDLGFLRFGLFHWSRQQVLPNVHTYLPSYKTSQTIFIIMLSFVFFSAFPCSRFPRDLPTNILHAYAFTAALVRERTIPTERPPLVGEVVPTFADRGCHVVSTTDRHAKYW